MDTIRDEIADYESGNLSNKVSVQKSRAESFVRFDNALRQELAEAWDAGLDFIADSLPVTPGLIDAMKLLNPHRARRSNKYYAAALFINGKLAFTEVETPWTDAEGLKDQQSQMDEIEKIRDGLTIPEALHILEFGE